MKGKKILLGILGATILCGAAPTAYAVNFNVPNITASKSADDEIIFQTGFDSEQDVSQFTGRGGVETIAAVTDDGHSENTCMKISDRTAGWNGPQLALAGKCEAGTEYLVSAWVKAQWIQFYKISLEYTELPRENVIIITLIPLSARVNGSRSLKSNSASLKTLLMFTSI